MGSGSFAQSVTLEFTGGPPTKSQLFPLYDGKLDMPTVRAWAYGLELLLFDGLAEGEDRAGLSLSTFASASTIKVTAGEQLALRPVNTAVDRAAVSGACVVPLSLPQGVHMVPLTDGINNRPYRTMRHSFIQHVLTRVMELGVVLILAPPQAGKTSTLQLAAAHVDWLRQQYPQHGIEVYFVTMLGHSTLDAAVCQQHPQFEQGWRDIVASQPASSAGAPGQLQPLRLLLLDEAQKTFHDDLWLEQLKMTQQAWPWCPIRILAAATYGPESSELPIPAVSFRLHPEQIVTVQPVQLPTSGNTAYSPAVSIGRLSLCFAWHELLEVHQAWGALHGVQLGQDILQYIYLLAGGQPGLVTLTLDFLARVLPSKTKAEGADAVNMFVSYKLASLGFLNACCQARSIPTAILNPYPKGVPSETRGVLGKLLYSPGNFYERTLGDAEHAAVCFLDTIGVIVIDNTDFREAAYRFATPMHEFAFAYHFYYKVDAGVQSLATLIPLLIRRLSPVAMAESEGRTPRTAGTAGNPVAGIYHHAAYHALVGLLPRDATGREHKAVASSFVGQGDGVDGYLDYYIGEPWCWGIEFVRDGRGMAEHVQRFAPGGPYHKMVSVGQLKEYAVLDFRSVSTGAPGHIASADELADLSVIRVSFSPDYTQATVRISQGGVEQQPEQIVAVGSDIGFTSSTSRW